MCDTPLDGRNYSINIEMMCHYFRRSECSQLENWCF